MKNPGSLFAISLLLLTGLACGTSSRQLQSISISPSIADAQSSPNGQVQFVATGHYNRAPMSSSPLPVLWGLLPGMSGQAGATITQSGLAQCAQGASGSFSVATWAPADPNISIGQLSSAKKAVVGTAVLTCP